MDDNERKYWVAFTRIPRVGTVRVREMERHFGTLSKAWAADSEELGRAGLDRRTAQNVVTRRPDINPDAEMEKLEAQQVQALTWHDPEYPAPLKEIHDPPPVLYVRGRLLPEDQRSVYRRRYAKGDGLRTPGSATVLARHCAVQGYGRERTRLRRGRGRAQGRTRSRGPDHSSHGQRGRRHLPARSRET